MSELARLDGCLNPSTARACGSGWFGHARIAPVGGRRLPPRPCNPTEQRLKTKRKGERNAEWPYGTFDENLNLIFPSFKSDGCLSGLARSLSMQSTKQVENGSVTFSKMFLLKLF